MKIGTKIRKAREAGNMDVPAAADAAKVSRQMGCTWEKQVSIPRVDTLERIAKALGVTSVDILSIDEEKDLA